MAKHEELTEPKAIHPAAFVSATDPALNPDNEVAANKLWIDTSAPAPYVLKKRNTLNTLWEVVGGSGVALGPIGPPGIGGEEGDAGEVGPPGQPGAAGVSAPENGWTAAGETWTFDTADAPTFTFKITGADKTLKYTPGTKLQLTHSAAVKYFIVTAVAFAAGDTTVTVYGGTDYTLAAGAITLPFFSRDRSPASFPLNPAKWSVVVTDTSNRSQASPVSGTWYNLGSITISIPIGAWYVDWQAQVANDGGGAETTGSVNATLSTGSSSETDKEFSAFFQVSGLAAAGDVFGWASRQKILNLASKTSYFLNAKTGNATSTSINFRGDISTTVVRAICAYM